ncbi:MAG TPA: rod shape-determining protein RodA [Acidimicrobiales bacterium]|jgi:rod shape determining protein RodA|nr:rod shape-determining protein RodA [Acidimicrobiales bacterium]
MARGALDLRRAPARGLSGTRALGRRRRDDSWFHPRAPAAWKHVDLVLLGCALSVSALGALMILSSTRGTDPDAYDPSYLRRQVLFIGIGMAGMVAVTLVDYRRLRDFAWLPYVAVLFILGLVLSPLGTEQRGTQAWFQLGAFQLQPAELAKVVTVFALAALFARFEPPLPARRLAVGLALCGLPVGLILAQPDLGTALVFVAIVTGMVFVGGARMRHIVVLTAFGVIAVIGVLNSDLLEDYQRDRLTEFLEQDQGLVTAETYNLDQSKAAIASGGTSGKGLFEGTQTRLGFVPEQHTDFIFTALGEELGFAGSATLLALFALMCLRILRTAQIAHDRLGTLICAGVLSMLVFQVFQNVGMTMGIMPITGITLPFMSYGGSSVVASWLAVGLVLNVHMRRFG